MKRGRTLLGVLFKRVGFDELPTGEKGFFVFCCIFWNEQDTNEPLTKLSKSHGLPARYSTESRRKMSIEKSYHEGTLLYSSSTTLCFFFSPSFAAAVLLLNTRPSPGPVLVANAVQQQRRCEISTLWESHHRRC